MPKDDLLIFRSPSRITVQADPYLWSVARNGYQYNQTDAAMNNDFKSGGWRVGIQCEGSETTFPWRWAIGSQDSLPKWTATVRPSGTWNRQNGGGVGARCA